MSPSDRILVVTQQLGSVRTGVGTYANHLVAGLRDRGLRVCVATFAESCGELAGVDYVRLDRVGWDPTPGAWYSVARGLARKLRGRRFDLVHFTDAREALGHVLKAPAVGTVHDAYALDCPRSPLRLRRDHPDWARRAIYYAVLRRLEPVAYRRLSFVMTNAEDTRRKIVAGYGLDPGRVRTVRYGIDAPGPVAPEPLEGNPAVLFAGSNFFRKGLHQLVLAVHRTVGSLPGLRVHVAGADPNRSAIEALAARLGVADRLRFHGRVPRPRLLAMMAGAELFCMPSRTEAYGLVFLESMALGTPVIGGRAGGTPELIRHGVNGLLVDPEDAGDLARQLIRLQRDERLRERLVRGGRETLDHHSVDAMLEATLEVYRGLGVGGAPTRVPRRDPQACETVTEAVS
ncbi:MAG: glycosyltransferase family 4 protein [Planctomycetes bacterium]|nr:glycosyltransferase family 4 protein [Planctomycetota bacterium]